MQKQKQKKRVAVPYFGGKFRLLDFILPYLPQTKIFVDVFGGGGSVVYNKPLSPITVYNDKAREVYTFYKVLRDDYDSLAHLLKYTPYCYDLFKEAYHKLRKSNEPLSELQIAWYWFILIRQSFGAKGDSFARECIDKKEPLHFLKSVSNLSHLSDFFKRISIDNLDYRELVLKYDTEDTLFYLDPPYLLESNKKASEAYFHSFNLEQHQELISFIKTLKGKVCISHYKTDLYEEGLSDWRKAYKERKITVNNNENSRSGKIITEALYMNYDIQEIKNNEKTNNKLFL